MTATMRGRIRAGDADAFGDLFDEHAQAVYRYAAWMDGDAAGAEDVVSLTFLEAWRIRDTLRPDGESPHPDGESPRPDGESPRPDGESLRPWLLGIATNVLRNRRRAARRHRAAMSRLPVGGAVPDFADEVVGRMHDSDQLTAATAALTALRRTDREVFLLCVWQQVDYAAAAEALDIPVGTVRSRLSRARVRLRTLAEVELHHRRRQEPDAERHALRKRPATEEHTAGEAATANPGSVREEYR
ncbi:RNA polymerase sigma factor [Actinoplanes awajinensis]|uniref:RNA polymerase sigma factor n=1 Tax=Actinoplanes awajinensis TaxID=135946 RepID=UPI000B15B4C7|nr:RNA polymerase sigma factor [Actinoplanes awajinensis]